MQFTTIHEHQGLKFTTNVQTNAGIVALVGRNGSGKTRLLDAIVKGQVQLADGGTVIPTASIRCIPTNELSPSIVSGYEATRFREMRAATKALYESLKGRILRDESESLRVVGTIWPGSQVRPHQFLRAVFRAAKTQGKDPNDLRAEDVGDGLKPDDVESLGYINLTATMLGYFDRKDDNDYADFLNQRHGECLPHYSVTEFQARFGPPPWILFNEVLRDVFDGRYAIDTPTRASRANYDARLRRTDTNERIDATSLSSGERVLMWLALSMHAGMVDSAVSPPKLLLLDEPDGPLHPRMVQKLHSVLRTLKEYFDLRIIFTTHSPTTVATFDGPIWEIDEHRLDEVSKEAAIDSLLIGLNSVYFHYTKAKPVYVESFIDSEIYTEVFAQLRQWFEPLKSGGTLNFIPAGPKIPDQSLRDLVKKHLSIVNPDLVEPFIQSVNGQGDCSRVYGAVMALSTERAAPIHGIVDWDLKNEVIGRTHVLAPGIFYSIENAILNPLTIGLYLLQNFVKKFPPTELGLPADFDRTGLAINNESWQHIADAVSKKLLQTDTVQGDIECDFIGGAKIRFDKRIAHMNGHTLLRNLLEVFPFLKSKKDGLLVDVVNQGMGTMGGRCIPRVFADLFLEIQKFTTA